MSSLTIRNIDDEIKKQLRLRAAAHGRSMEAEVRHILREALSGPTASDLVQRIRGRFRDCGAELEFPQRQSVRTPPKLD
ncbi:FitA-like ribbon-helix-helix domain-containing protein [Geoalkalibacter halelectricus]|uniref:Arc family DNA-binding protein n=1 Tax=Geoalkalibacter halelectricus TaxID=2847045 RepID=A0ABY5ZQH5_9BACT|nr:Arc family DNA-binding protein [Geoalkalibacter halelectricus]MDO3378738.1 Arc family DNA-binding protein [Geoalkalibacter halelectricus]UWZ79954.1 Arc family DNA-binding protein [Geoalkalibacter halelectricus]